MKKLLIAVDSSPCAMNAVNYVARQFNGTKDLVIGLVNVLPNLPAIFWDEGHILSDSEKQDRQKVVDKWIADQQAKMEPVLRKAAEILNENGISGEIMTRSISDSTDVAESILEVARDEGYRTIVIGRCGFSTGKNLLLGGITNKILARADDVTVTVVA